MSDPDLTNTIIPELEDTRSDKEIARGMELVSNAMFRRQAKANEVKLKGFYVDFVFDRLNLNRYR